jgi:hypothetical protein
MNPLSEAHFAARGRERPVYCTPRCREDYFAKAYLRKGAREFWISSKPEVIAGDFFSRNA